MALRLEAIVEKLTEAPSVLRGYEQALRQRVLPALGGTRFSELRRSDVQDLADRLIADRLDPSTCGTR